MRQRASWGARRVPPPPGRAHGLSRWLAETSHRTRPRGGVLSRVVARLVGPSAGSAVSSRPADPGRDRAGLADSRSASAAPASPSEWAPLRAMAYRDANLGARLVLSALFPLVAMAAFPRARARPEPGLAARPSRSARSTTCWRRRRDVHASQLRAWSARRRLFVLFLAAMRTVLRQSREAGLRWRVPRLAACAFAWTLTSYCGLSAAAPRGGDAPLA